MPALSVSQPSHPNGAAASLPKEGGRIVSSEGIRLFFFRRDRLNGGLLAGLFVVLDELDFPQRQQGNYKHIRHVQEDLPGGQALQQGHGGVSAGQGAGTGAAVDRVGGGPAKGIDLGILQGQDTVFVFQEDDALLGDGGAKLRGRSQCSFR